MRVDCFNIIWDSILPLPSEVSLNVEDCIFDNDTDIECELADILADKYRYGVLRFEYCYLTRPSFL